MWHAIPKYWISLLHAVHLSSPCCMQTPHTELASCMFICQIPSHFYMTWNPWQSWTSLLHVVHLEINPDVKQPLTVSIACQITVTCKRLASNFHILFCLFNTPSRWFCNPHWKLHKFLVILSFCVKRTLPSTTSYCSLYVIRFSYLNKWT